MKNNLKGHRKLKNLTQEELSKSSGISIRTIQRIEKGLSTGSSHTLKTLARTLSIESTDILHDESNPRLFEKKNINTLKLMNFSVLTMLIIPFGNIIFPAIIYFKNRDDGKINTIGKKILNFQILSMLVLPFFLVILFLLIGRGYAGLTMTFIASYFTYGLANIIITIYTSIQINEEKEVLSFVPNIL
ncbi:MAG: helix-turn-helix domain-containing protein [Flavobacteriaceae bacterium]